MSIPIEEINLNIEFKSVLIEEEIKPTEIKPDNTKIIFDSITNSINCIFYDDLNKFFNYTYDNEQFKKLYGKNYLMHYTIIKKLIGDDNNFLPRRIYFDEFHKLFIKFIKYCDIQEQFMDYVKILQSPVAINWMNWSFTYGDYKYIYDRCNELIDKGDYEVACKIRRLVLQAESLF